MKSPGQQTGAFHAGQSPPILVRITGLEPARHGHWTLKPARLPIPPYPHTAFLLKKQQD